ncbi:MAG: hydrogenase expression/formation protein [Burkholderiaceae bacterium]
MHTAKPFPVPLVPALGPGSQPDDEALGLLPMPRNMRTFDAPPLPEPQAFAARQRALGVLHEAQVLLQRSLAGEAVAPIDLRELPAADRALVNQVLGEGEVAAQLAAPQAMQAQESVFAGIWRVLAFDGAVPLADTLEVGPFPQGIALAARERAQAMPPLPAPLPAGAMNAPAVLEELRSRAAAWQPGTPAHVVNLSLLPVTPGDSELFEAVLGRGAAVILSRGYGNCRISSTGVRHVWRVTYFNSQDMIILDTLEVGDVPEVACAAREDLQDSAERLADVLQWVQST